MVTQNDNSARRVDMIGKLRDALMKDFNALYVKEYSTTWEVSRMVRNAEIGFMPFTHTLELLKSRQVMK
jgi:hypothetical protein